MANEALLFFVGSKPLLGPRAVMPPSPTSDMGQTALFGS